MRKLLLILICLFVSNEVKSESDDLYGKNLVCENTKVDVFLGFKFLKDLQVLKVGFTVDNGPISINEKLVYKTTIKKIHIDLWSIDRFTLEFFDSSKKVGLCKLVKEDVEFSINKIIDKLMKELKSKQKI